MAGLDFNFNGFDKIGCPQCPEDVSCCDDSCLARFVVAECGAIDVESPQGDIVGAPDYARFCEPKGITSFSSNLIQAVNEKNYMHLCKPFRRAGNTDFSFSITSDICQGDLGTALLMRRKCPFDFMWIPNACNFNGDLGQPYDQQTYVIWGRAIGSDVNWTLPENNCQEFTREYQISGYCWETDFEALLPTAEPQIAPQKTAKKAA